MSKNDQDVQSVALVHERLRNAIILGDIEAGHVTSQVALAKEMDVGRTPLREALRHLQTEGLVSGEPNRRVRVSELTWEDAEELYLVRILLETTAVRLTVPQLDSSDIAEMRGYIAQMDHYGDGQDWSGLREPHKAFHLKFVDAAGPRMTNMISDAFDHAERYRLAYFANSEEQWAARQDEHNELVSAANEREAERTAETLARHYIRIANGVLTKIDPDRKSVKLGIAAQEAGLDVSLASIIGE